MFTENLDHFFSDGDFAQSFVLTVGTGTSAVTSTGLGIFSAGYEEVAGGEVQSVKPTLVAKSTAVSSAVMFSQVVVAGGTYRICNIAPDESTLVTTLQLEKQ